MSKEGKSHGFGDLGKSDREAVEHLRCDVLAGDSFEAATLLLVAVAVLFDNRCHGAKQLRSDLLK